MSLHKSVRSHTVKDIRSHSTGRTKYQMMKSTRIISGVCLLLLFQFLACSSSPVEPPLESDQLAAEGEPSAVGPMDLPHPVGLDLTDLRELFFYKGAPTLQSLVDCDKEILQLIEVTQATQEVRRGTRELVRGAPSFYHWCFYGKLLSLNQTLKSDDYIDSKQKQTIATFSVLVPLARVMVLEFQDSRYLRWAVKSYQRVSEWVFYRRLELSPFGTSELIGYEGEGAQTRRSDREGESVIGRYGIKAPSAAVAKPETSPDKVSDIAPDAVSDTEESEQVQASATDRVPAQATEPVETTETAQTTEPVETSESNPISETKEDPEAEKLPSL